MKKNGKTLVNLSTKTFIQVVVLLFVLMLAAIVLTYVVPKGEFGKLTDEAGSSHQVFILVAELEGIDRYPQDVQDTLYAMQEAVNVVFEHLN